MNLEEKAKTYIKPFKHQIHLGEQQNCIDDFKNGYKESIKDIEQITTANPKMSASDMVKELKKLI